LVVSQNKTTVSPIVVFIMYHLVRTLESFETIVDSTITLDTWLRFTIKHISIELIYYPQLRHHASLYCPDDALIPRNILSLYRLSFPGKRNKVFTVIVSSIFFPLGHLQNTCNKQNTYQRIIDWSLREIVTHSIFAANLLFEYTSIR
jgi:hypothetical protein